MDIKCRRYKDENDYKLICDFFEKSYEKCGTKFDNNLTLFQFQCALSQGRGETIKSIDEVLENVFLWFDGEEIIGMIVDGEFCISKDYRDIFIEVVKIAEEHYLNKNNVLEMNVYDNDKDFEKVLLDRGYEKTEEYWVRREFDFENTIEKLELPEGMYIETVPNIKDQEQVYKAYKLCYGILFNKNIFDKFYETSTYVEELDKVVVDKDGNVVALCSSRYDKKNKLVTIEAVSCIPEYRRKGITRALMLDSLNSAKELGARKASVYTAMPERFPAPNNLYESLGFNLVGNIYVWEKQINK